MNPIKNGGQNKLSQSQSAIIGDRQEEDAKDTKRTPRQKTWSPPKERF